MNDTSSTGPRPLDTFALVIVKSHASQPLIQSLLTLHGLSVWVSDFFVLHGADCAPTDAESIEISRLGVRTHIREIDIGRMNETLNIVLSAAQQNVFVLLRAGDQLPLEFFKTMSAVVDAHVSGGLFYPVAQEVDSKNIPTRVFANLRADQINANRNLQEPCAFTGLTIRKSHLVEMGGFHVGCQMVGELDFWLRTYLTLSHALIHVPQLQVKVQKPDSSWILKFGARQVLEWCTLIRQFAGWCSAAKFTEYAEQLHAISTECQNLSPGFHEHLCDMANRLLFMIDPAERSALQPWLQNSIAVSTQRPELKAIDDVLRSSWQADLSSMPNLYDGGFSIHSIGSFCHAAQVLKDLGLRRHTGPFDWIFSNAAAATHMFEDHFKTFLEPAYFKEVLEEDKVDPSSNVCDHLYYKEHFGVKFMFNHHRPFEKTDGDFFRNAVSAIESDLGGQQPCILFHVARMNGKPEDFLALWESMKSRSAPKRLLIVRFTTVSEEEYLAKSIEVVRHQDPEVLEFHLPVVSKTNGVHFADPRDNRRLKRLVYSYSQLVLSEISKQPVF